jgi:hypothetical protein
VGNQLREILDAVRSDGRQRTVRCPAHEDRRSSLSVGRGEQSKLLLHCHVGCSLADVLAAAGLTHADLHGRLNGHTSQRREIVYCYHDEQGNHLYDVVRFPPKSFRQRRADGSWNMDGVRRVVYRLPELRGQTTVFVAEGEKDTDRLWALGIPATTNVGGASKWSNSYTEQLRAAGVQSVVILPDNDEPGRAHADNVARSCMASGLQAKIVALPGVPPKGDVSDWIAAGHTRDELAALVESAPRWTPAANTADEPLPLTSIADLLSEPDTSREWLVADRLLRGSVNLLAGRPKGGKSTLARALALSVARGEPWLGHPCRHGRVVYVALEDKRSEVRRHLRMMRATGKEHLRFLIGSAPRDLLARLAAMIDAGDRMDLLIIDTAQRLLAVKDSNDYAAVTLAFEPVLSLARRHDTCIMLLHHVGKADRAGIEAVMGSTAWAASVDNILILNRRERYRLLSTVQRIGPDLDETVVLMDEASGEVRFGGSRYLADIEHVMHAMREIVTTAGAAGVRRDELLADVEARRELKLKALQRLLADPTIERIGAGTKNDPHRYRVCGEPESPTPQDSDSGSQVPLRDREPEFHLPLSPIDTDTDCGSRVYSGSQGSPDPAATCIDESEEVPYGRVD